MRKYFPVIAALVVGAAVAIGAVALLGGGDDDDAGKSAGAPKTATTKNVATLLEGGSELSGPEDAFQLRYPKGWKVLTEEDLKAGGSGTRGVAGVQRDDGSALLVVEQRGKLDTPLNRVPDDLTKQLKKAVKDFKFVSSKGIKLPAGDALSYTFIRTGSNAVQNLTVVPSGAQTYTLNSILGGKSSSDAAQEVAAIVRSFDPED